MARLNRLISEKVKGSTLIEVVVSMLIAAICFSLAFATLGQLTTFQVGQTRTMAEREVNNTMEESLEEKNYLKDEISFEDFYIQKEVTKYPQNAHLIQLTITAFRPDGEVLTAQKRIVYEMVEK